MSPIKFLDGQRPTPLKLKQESHTIHKHHNQQQIRKPIIIYNRSPKVIHTKPHEFMALVQKLTGHSGSKPQEQQQQRQKETLEGYGLNDDEFYGDIMKVKSSNPFESNIPFFTPNTSDYLFTPQRFLKFSDEY